jgi:hypothetical protein
MIREKIFLPRLTLSTALVVVLIFSIGCQDAPPEKVQVPMYPTLRESFDQDFHHALETNLKQEFRGEYKRAVENKKAVFI